LYVKNPTAYNHVAYLESIRAFNGGYEHCPSDGIPKNSLDDFINSFDKLIETIKRDGFDVTRGVIPIQKNGDISDGAHRLAICAALGINIEVEVNENHDAWLYSFFLQRGMNKRIMDYGALEYVKLNPNAYIVNLHSVTNPQNDNEVIRILEKYGFVYYKRNVKLSLNGYANLKKISYGSFWNNEQWIGTPENGFAGALDHAKHTTGEYPCRVFVFVCDNLEKVLRAKAEIRAIYNIGNYSVHINDTHEEAIWLAETYFNENSLFWVKNRPLGYEDKIFDDHIEYFKQAIFERGGNADDYCVIGSAPLNAYGITHTNKIEYVTSSIISPQDDAIIHREIDPVVNGSLVENIVTNPIFYFYYHGIKVCSIPTIFKIKIRRGKKGDFIDCIRMSTIWVRTWGNSYYRWKKKVKTDLKDIKWLVALYMSVKRLVKRK
jgi:hypothetical protein